MTFLHREIAALRAHGVHIETLSVCRRTPSETADESERDSTMYLRSARRLRVLTVELLEETGYPGAEEFRAATDRVMEDFRDGWWHVWNAVREASPIPLYRGLNCGETLAGRAGVAEREWLRASAPGL
jgi:hypothetical protein